MTATPTTWIRRPLADDSDSGDMGMQMTFYNDYRVTILFDWWATKTLISYVVSLGLIFAFTVFSVWLQKQSKVYALRRAERVVVAREVGESLLGGSAPASRGKLRTGPERLVASALYAASFSAHFLVMLVVMTFNAGVFLTVALGALAGHFLFLSDEDVSLACG
eukprot:tig00000403_g309.t1